MNVEQSIPVAKVENFMAVVVKNFEDVESRIITLKTRVAKRTIGNDSILRELDEMLTVIRS